MSAADKWAVHRSEIKEVIINVRLTAAQAEELRRLSHQFNIPLSQVVRDLMLDGLKLLRGTIRN